MKNTIISKQSLILVLLCVLLISSKIIKSQSSLDIPVIPGGFIQNMGQIYDEDGNYRDDIYFSTQVSGTNIFFTDQGVVLYFKNIEPSDYEKILAQKIPNPYSDSEWEDIMLKCSKGEYDGDLFKTKEKAYRIDITFPGASLKNAIGEDNRPEKQNYYNPNNPDGLKDVPSFNRIRYKNVYEGIDLIFYISSGKLKYDFELRPNSDPSQIKILYDGHQDIQIDEDGNAIVNILPGKIIENKPVSFQNGKTIESQFSLSNDTIMFQIYDYDPSQTLTIDPTLTWSSYFHDGLTSAAFTYTNPSWDSNGNMYIVFNTYNKTTFPVINPGGTVYYQSTAGDNGLQLIIMKFNTDRQIVWATYYAGSQSTKTKYSNQSVAIDQNDNLYIIGSVFYVYASPSPSFPLYDQGGSAYYETEQGNNRNFILKFSSTGDRLWATMFNKTTGSSSSGLELQGITIDNNNKPVITGCTYTPSSWNPMPLVNPGGSYYYNGAPVESQVPTIHRFTTAGVLEWSTYISQGASSTYCGSSSQIAIDNNNNLFLSSAANSTYTTVNPGGAYTDGTIGSGRKISIFKFASTGALNWCTLYGGTSSANSVLWQDIRDLKIASNGDVFLVGRVNTTDFPTYNPGGGAYMKTTLSTGSTSVCDGVILQFSNSGVRKWATYYGGNGTSDGTDFIGVGIDASDNVTVSGISRSPSFPTLSKTGSYNQSSITADYAIVFAQFDINGVRQWASYFGDKTYYSSGGFGVSASACGTKYMQCGYTDNAYTITTVDPGSGAYYQSANEGSTGQSDIFVELLDESSGANSTAPTSLTASQTTVCAGTNVSLTVNGGSLGSGASWELYSGSCGGTFVSSNTSGTFTVSPTSTTTYYVLASGPCNTTSCQSVTINMAAESTDPTSATATNTTICTGSSTDLSVNGGSLGANASWEWYSGSCGGTYIGSGTTINVSPTSSTIYYVRAEGDCNTTSCVSIAITVNSSASAGTDNSISVCEYDPSFDLFTQLGGSPTGGGTWTNSGGSTVTSTFDPSTMASDVFTYTVTGTPPCSDATATITVNVNPLPTVSFTGLDSVYCGGSDPIILTGNQAPNGTFAGMDVTDNGNGTADYTHATPGTYDITYSYTNSFGCTNTDTQTVIIYTLPNVSFVGLDTAYCLGDPIDDIIGNQAPNGTFTGTGVSDNGNGSATYDPSTTGIQVIIYEYTDGNGCTASDAQTVEVYELPYANIVNIADPSVCTPPFDGSIEIIASGGTGSYQYAIDGGIPSSNNTFTGLGMGTYTITIEDDFGCSSDTIITVNGSAGFTIDYINSNNITCYGSADGSATVIISGSGNATYNWSNNDTTASITGLTAGNYYITVTDSLGCTAIDSIIITEPSELSYTDSIHQISCYGQNDGEIYITTVGGTSPYNYIWVGTDNFISSNENISNLYDGVYSLTITDANGCDLSKIEFHITEPDELTFSSVSSQTSCIGNDDGAISSIHITGGSAPYSLLWNTNPPQTDTVLTDLLAGEYTLSITDANNCTTIRDIPVYDGNTECFKIPSVFTPNNDGKNDYWNIQGLEDYPDAIVEVYNRWGDIIFKSTGYNDPWDGTFNGKELPISSYVYIIILNNETEPLQGIVTIKK